LGEVARCNQVLNGLRLVGGISDEEADGRLEGVLEKLGPEGRDPHRRFVGTVLASLSEAGTEQLVDPKVPRLKVLGCDADAGRWGQAEAL
jgi:hypothetical protein